MSKTTPKTKSPAKIKALKTAFVVSLALNALVVGVIVGGAINGKRPQVIGGYDLSLGPFGAALSREDRGKIRDDLRERPELRLVTRAARDAAIKKFMDAVRADPYDDAALRALFEEQRALGATAMAAGQNALLDRLAEMTPEERALFADRAEQSIKRAIKGPR